MHIQNPDNEEVRAAATSTLCRRVILHPGTATAALGASGLRRSFYSPRSRWNPHIPPGTEPRV